MIFVAIRQCPICKREYDDEINESCPFCNEQKAEDTIEEKEAVIDEISSNSEAELSLPENFNDFSESDEEYLQGEEAGANKGLKIAAIALTAVLVVLLAVFAFSKLGGKKSENYFAGIIKSEVKDSIDNAKKFTEKDLDGTFTDSINNVYYTFSTTNASLEIPTATEEIAENTSDSSADSSADSKTTTAKTETVEYDGTYTSGMTQAGIRELVIIDYIESNGLTQEYMEYIETKNILSSDFDGFIKEKGLEEDVNLYDSENGLSKEYALGKIEGYWNFEDGLITLFDENGEDAGEYIVKDQGIINADYLYKGAIPSKKDFYAVYSMKIDNYGAEQELSIRLYRDGYCVLEMNGGASPSLQAGTYKTDDNGIYISINGQNIFFYVTDIGICNEILTK